MDKFNQYVEQVEEDLKDKKFEEFLHKRKDGAKKIAGQARTKGGVSILTAIHFDAKEKPYAMSLKYANDKKKALFYKKKAKEVYDRLSNLDSLSQRDFQALMGELEVWGEVYIKTVKPTSVKV
jgi:hypothetical protein